MAAPFHFFIVAPRRVRRAAPVIPPVLTEEETEALTEALTELLTEGTEFLTEAVTDFVTDFVTESGTGFLTEGSTPEPGTEIAPGPTDTEGESSPTDNFNTEDGDNSFDIQVEMFTNNSATIDVDVPPGETGDLLVLVSYRINNQSGINGGLTDWTSRYDGTALGGISRIQAYTKIADGSETTLTVSYSTSNPQTVVIARVGNTDGYDVSAGVYVDSNLTAQTLPSVTTTQSGDLLLAFSAWSTQGDITSGDLTRIRDYDAQAPSFAVFADVQGAAGATGTKAVSTAAAPARSAGFVVAAKPKGAPAFRDAVEVQQDAASDELEFLGQSNAFRYWRVWITDDAGSTGIDCAEVEMRIGGVDQTGSGTATASDSFDGLTQPGNAFDNNTATRWASAFNNTYPKWLKYDFGAGNGKALDALTWRVSQAANRGIRDFLIQGSHDDVNWFTAYTGSAVTWSSSTETKTFSFTSPTPPILSGLALGDSMLAYVAASNDAGVITPPAGWTLAEGGGVLFGSDGYNLWCFTKQAGAADVIATSYVFTSEFSVGEMTGNLMGFKGDVARTNITYGTNQSETSNLVNAGVAYQAGDIAVFGIMGRTSSGAEFTSADGTLIESTPASTVSPALRTQYDTALADGQGMVADIDYSVGSSTVRITAIIV